MNDDWSKQWFEAFTQAMQQWGNTIAQDAEQGLEELTTHLAQASDAFLQATDDWADQVQQALEPELEEFIDDLNRTLDPLEAALEAQVDQVADQLDQAVGPVLVTLLGQVDSWIEEISAPLNRTLDPILQDHPTCVGCRNYHGQAYGGEMLVCALYPYGPDQNPCPDHDSMWPTPDP